MRKRLSDLIAREAKKNPRVIVLSGDHGHDFFKPMLEHAPEQFINCGIIETAMVGIAAGLARSGHLPIVYGLASFIPIKVIEQIKMDFCQAGLSAVFIGDGAGFVYTTMGPSHQSIEDIACLRSLPGVQIYSPFDEHSMEDYFTRAIRGSGVSYVRVGKSGRRIPEVAQESEKPEDSVCIVSHGAMVSAARRVAARLGTHVLEVPHVNAGIPDGVLWRFKIFIVVEDHGPGGLATVLAEQASRSLHHHLRPSVQAIGPRGFSRTTGSYDHMLAEHEMNDRAIEEKIRFIIGRPNA